MWGWSGRGEKRRGDRRRAIASIANAALTLASLVFPLSRLTPQLRGAQCLHHLVQGGAGACVGGPAGHPACTVQAVPSRGQAHTRGTKGVCSCCTRCDAVRLDLPCRRCPLCLCACCRRRVSGGQRTCFGTPCQAAIIVLLPRLNAVPCLDLPQQAAEERLRRMGPMRASEKIVMCTLSCAVLLWVSRGGRRACWPCTVQVLDPGGLPVCCPCKCACYARRCSVPCRFCFHLLCLQ